MMQFVNALHEPKLSFTQLKPSTDYIAWRAMMPLKCTKSLKYTHPVTKNETGGYDFKSDMNPEDSSTLFMLIYDALGQMSEKLIVDVSNPNGHDLLQQLEDYYVDIDTSVVNKQILLQEFDNMKRQQNETYTHFALRFLRKMKELSLNKVTVPTDEATLAYKYLRGLNETRINTEICLDLANKKDWYENLTLTEVAKKAQRYMRQYSSLLKTSSNPGQSKTTTTSTSQKKEHEKAKQPKQDTSSNDKPADAAKSAHEEKVKTMEQYLSKANNVKSYLRGIKRNDKDKFSSKVTKNACTNLEIFDVWSKVNQEDAEQRTAAARRVKTENPDSTSFADMLKQALQEQRETLLEEFKDIQMKENDDTESHSNNDSNNESNPYALLYTVDLPSNNAETYSHPIIDKPNASPTTISANVQHSTTHQLITDSGATDTMTGEKDYFEEITYYDPVDRPEVTLGDNTTTCPIHGYGYINMKINNFTIQVLALYVPDLQNIILYSIKQYMQYRGAYFHAENNEALLAFPTFAIQLQVNDEIEIPVVPTSNIRTQDFDEHTATPCLSNNNMIQQNLIKANIASYIPPSKQQQFTQQVCIKKLIPEAIIPSQATVGAIGYDVRAVHPHTVQPNEIIKVPTGLAVSMPSDMYLRIALRSSLALKHITIEGGAVDSDYRGRFKSSSKTMALHLSQSYQLIK